METLKIQVYEIIQMGQGETETPRPSFGVLGRLLSPFKVSFRITNTLPRPPSYTINPDLTSAFSFA